jgi:hypothetical protein
MPPESNPGAEILELINKARVVLEMAPLRRLPRGIPETSRQCVLGRSLGVEVLLDDRDRAYGLLPRYRTALRLARVWDTSRPYGMWNGWAVLLPEELNTFVHEFDARCYPALASAASGLKDSVDPELRRSQFDWVDQHKRIADLLERARAACEHAERVRHESADRRTTLANLVGQASAACERTRETENDWADEHARAIALLKEASIVCAQEEETQNQWSEAQSAAVDLIKCSSAACDGARVEHMTQQRSLDYAASAAGAPIAFDAGQFRFRSRQIPPREPLTAVRAARHSGE